MSYLVQLKIKSKLVNYLEFEISYFLLFSKIILLEEFVNLSSTIFLIIMLYVLYVHLRIFSIREGVFKYNINYNLKQVFLSRNIVQIYVAICIFYTYGRLKMT